MADEPNIEAQVQKLDFVGMEDVVGVFSDAFFIANAGESFTVYFFQNQIADVAQRELKTTEHVKLTKTRCIARIVLSPTAMLRLVEAMATNIGFSLVENTEEEASK